MVWTYSRQIFLRFFLDARMENFLCGHVQAFESWCGVPRVILYDNLRRPVLGPQRNDIRFHPILFEFAGHYRYEPRPVATARGNERGRMERAIRYLRTSFFAAREFVDLDDINAQADLWCRAFVGDRRCPERSTHNVRVAFAEKAHLLLELPSNAYPLLERRARASRTVE
jgi:transposase